MNQDKIMLYWESQPRRGSIDDQLQVCMYGEAESIECGDTISLDILPRGGIIQEAKHSGKGCVLSQAGASMLTEYLVGKTIDEAAAMTNDQMLNLYEGRPIPVRLGCCLLPLKALKQCFE